jgi:hypothetical protein
MKRMSQMAAIFALLLTLGANLQAQGTAFTYQGRLNNNGIAANGSYDMAFTLFTNNTGGVALVGPVTNSAVTVSNGLFTTTVDFGNAFTGTSNWLGIAVSTNGANTFSTLSPRQQLTPTPYAIFANTASNVLGTVSSSQLSGGIPAADISGTIPLAHLPATVITNGASGVNITGTFSGSGTNLTLGQSASTVYGTSLLTLAPTAAFTLIPGLTQTITVPANATVYISTSGGAETTSGSANGFSVVVIAIKIDGVLQSNGGYQLLDIFNNTSIVGAQNWFFSFSTTLTGTHTISVNAEGAAATGSTTAGVSGGPGSLLQGQLTSLVLKQ